MKNTLMMAALSMILAGSIVFGQRLTPNSPADQPGEVVITGTVTNFEVGKTIEIDAKGVSHKYDLNSADILYSISPEVAVGITVMVTERTDANRHKTITIAPLPKGQLF